jgi:hypothetical protein
MDAKGLKALMSSSNLSTEAKVLNAVERLGDFTDELFEGGSRFEQFFLLKLFLLQRQRLGQKAAVPAWKLEVVELMKNGHLQFSASVAGLSKHQVKQVPPHVDKWRIILCHYHDTFAIPEKDTIRLLSYTYEELKTVYDGLQLIPTCKPNEILELLTFVTADKKNKTKFISLCDQRNRAAIVDLITPATEDTDSDSADEAKGKGDDGKGKKEGDKKDAKGGGRTKQTTVAQTKTLTAKDAFSLDYNKAYVIARDTVPTAYLSQRSKVTRTGLRDFVTGDWIRRLSSRNFAQWLAAAETVEFVNQARPPVKHAQPVARDVDHEWPTQPEPLDTVTLPYKLDPNIYSVKKFPEDRLKQLVRLVRGCPWVGGTTRESVVSNELYDVLRYVKDGGPHGRELVLTDEQRKQMASIIGIDQNDIGLIGQFHPRFEEDRRRSIIDQGGTACNPWLFAVTHTPLATVISSSRLGR